MTSVVASYDYAIDRSDVIESVSEAWLHFAQINGAPKLTREAVIGRSLWEFMSGSDTRSFYRTLFHRVRSKQIEVDLPFRCDSPDLLRFMLLHIRPVSNTGLELSGRLVREEQRRRRVPLRNELPGDEGQSFVMCSLCKRVDAFGSWIEPEVAVKWFYVFETVREAEVQHGICGQCQDLADA